MKQFKGLSPLIASILLVAFTMAVAAIVVVWITGFTQQQTNVVGQRGENQAKCAYSTLSVSRNDISVVGSNLNVTVSYSAGTETLNITGISVRDSSSGASYVNVTSPNTDATVRNWGVGKSDKLVNYILTGNVLSWAEIRVTALCQNQFSVVGVVRPS